METMTQILLILGAGPMEPTLPDYCLLQPIITQGLHLLLSAAVSCPSNVLVMMKIPSISQIARLESYMQQKQDTTPRDFQ